MGIKIGGIMKVEMRIKGINYMKMKVRIEKWTYMKVDWTIKRAKNIVKNKLNRLKIINMINFRLPYNTAKTSKIIHPH